ncbi:MAG: aldehyde dehydrogenase family protein [Dehalococcoidia bacterium]
MGAAKQPTAYQMYIDGRWAGAESGASFDVLNPATEEVIATAPEASRDEMRRAIAAARQAFDEGPWPRMAQRERARILQQIADGLSANRERLAGLLTAEVGCAQFLVPIQLDDPIRFAHYYAELTPKIDFEEPLPPLVGDTHFGPAAMTQMLVVRQPIGVVGAINTWNFPLYVLIQKVLPALASGCTLVVKASPFAPLLNLEVARIIDETDLPTGVFNVVTGESAELGEEIVANQMVDKVSFTGSVPTGKRIAEAAARNLTRVHLELGGKSAAIVLDDVDLDLVAPALTGPTFVHAGQACAASTRCLVPAKLYDRALEKMVGFVTKLKVGNPSDPAVMVGPLIREVRRTAVEEFIRVGREEGATLATGGKRPPDAERGYFLEPTIFSDVRNDMRIASEEIFGPVLAVMPYSDIDEAVRIANDSRYGLSGSVVTFSPARGLEVAKRLRTGSVLITRGGGSPGATTFMVAPFGGFKESGIGREGGKYGVFEFTEIQSIAW